MTTEERARAYETAIAAIMEVGTDYTEHATRELTARWLNMMVELRIIDEFHVSSVEIVDYNDDYSLVWHIVDEFEEEA